jgi:hypothetical protein
MMGQLADADFKKRAEIHEQATKDALKVLTDEQRRAWKNLIGKEVAPEVLLAAVGATTSFGAGAFGGGGPVPLRLAPQKKLTPLPEKPAGN